ncbi:hypothetical protein F5Y07DRAFT_411130 [Xylaria sp. FL0933]|nr:hypothetical protein F5Y07DRAFT_411130 [Xylaria sp. FL0933]
MDPGQEWEWTRAQDHPPHLRFQHTIFDPDRDPQIRTDDDTIPDYQWRECDTCGLTWLTTPYGFDAHPQHCASTSAPGGRCWRSLKVCIWGTYSFRSACIAVYFANGSAYNSFTQEQRGASPRGVLLETLETALQIILDRVVPARQRQFSNLPGYPPPDEQVEFRVVIHAAITYLLSLADTFRTLERVWGGRNRGLWRSRRGRGEALGYQDHYNRINQLLHALARYGISVAWARTLEDQAREMFNTAFPRR